MEPQVISFIKHTADKGYGRYTTIINGKEEGLSWYGSFLSPENQPDDTLYLLKFETRRDYGTFGQWYIDQIIGRLDMVLASQDMYDALKEITHQCKFIGNENYPSLEIPHTSEVYHAIEKAYEAINKVEGR